MDNAQYVNTVGKLVNDSTKFNVSIDDTSVTNIVLINHLQSLYDILPFVYENILREVPWTLAEILERIEQFTHCLKKEINFYESKSITDNCVLTEVDGNIKIEDNTTNP